LYLTGNKKLTLGSCKVI